MPRALNFCIVCTVYNTSHGKIEGDGQIDSLYLKTLFTL